MIYGARIVSTASHTAHGSPSVVPSLFSHILYLRACVLCRAVGRAGLFATVPRAVWRGRACSNRSRRFFSGRSALRTTASVQLLREFN